MYESYLLEKGKGQKMYRRLVGLRRLSRADAIRRLQLEHDFSESDLKTAYLEKAKQFHPDNSTDDGEKFNQIKEAYQLLKVFLVWKYLISFLHENIVFLKNKVC